MAKTSYLIFVVRAHAKGDRSVEHELDTLGGAGDLLHGLHGAAHKLLKASKPHLNARFEQAFDVLDVQPAGRSLWLRADAGAYGVDGNTTNVDTRSRTRRGKRDASMTEKRAMFVIPKGSKVGFLFAERRGSSHLKNHIEETLTRACSAWFGVTVDITAYADAKAWDDFLQSGEGVEVKSVWRPRTIEQQFTGATLQDEGELQTIVTGGVAARVVRRVRADLRQLFGEQGSAADAYEIETPNELIPRDDELFEREQLALTMAQDNEKRTVVVEKGSPPQFFYPLQDRPVDALMKRTWVAEAEKVAGNFGLALPQGWSEGAWAREELRVGIRRSS